jgi:hypothetical protein
MLRAAGEFDSDIPIAATYIRKAASQVETVSDAIHPRKRLLMMRSPNEPSTF